MNIMVEDTLTTPNIMCGSNGSSTSVEFIWDPVANATDYTILIDAVDVATQVTTSYLVENLIPG